MSGREALQLYKSLHRTIQRVFQGDHAAMFAARDKVCEEFQKNRNVKNETAIKELINHGNEVQKILSESVIQVKQVDQERYRMKIRGETHMFENNPFREDVTEEEYKNANRKTRKRGSSCDEAKQQK